MRCKHDREDPDDSDVELAPEVTALQREELYALGYRGPSPSTVGQAEQILQRLRAAPAGSTEGKAGTAR